MLQAVPPADSLRRALGEVFARPDYAWVPRFSLGDWLHEQALRLLDGQPGAGRGSRMPGRTASALTSWPARDATPRRWRTGSSR